MPWGRVSTRPGRSATWCGGSSDMTARLGPRWVVWSATSTLRGVVAAGVDVARTWDLAEAHRIVHGGWWATPGHVVAGCLGLDEADGAGAPRRPGCSGFDGDLFDVVAGEDASLLTTAGHLRADALGWATDETRLRELAVLALDCRSGAARGARSHRRRARRPARAHRLVRVRGRRALPRARARRAARRPRGRRGPHRRLRRTCGPGDDADAARIRAERDAVVLRHAPAASAPTCATPGRCATCCSRSASTCPTPAPGCSSPTGTRTRSSTPCCAGARTSGSRRRTATAGSTTTSGADDRLRGGWTACDGAAGRMTAQNGLHNLPAPLRPADLRRAGPRLRPRRPRPDRASRARRGQRRPGVRRGDPRRRPLRPGRGQARRRPTQGQGRRARGDVRPALGSGGRGPQGPRARLPRGHGAARPGLRRRCRPATGAHVGRPAHPLRRRAACPPSSRVRPEPSGSAEFSATGADGARGRYARNAIIQGSAAELFKAWAATVRHAVRPLGGQIVLCLHDELLVHVPERRRRPPRPPSRAR